jgi:hypothetical protein
MQHQGTLLERNHCPDMREFSMRFALWCASLQTTPSVERIQARYQMSRATAYRWRAAWCHVQGQPTRAPTKPRPVPRNRVIKGSVQHGRAGVGASSACRNCKFYRPRSAASWWGDCLISDVPTKPHDTCALFSAPAKSSADPAATGKAKPQTSVGKI